MVVRRGRQGRLADHLRYPVIVKSLVASVVMAVAVWLVSPQGVVLTVPVVAGGVLIYGVILLALKGFSREEYRFFRGLFRRDPASVIDDDGDGAV